MFSFADTVIFMVFFAVSFVVLILKIIENLNYQGNSAFNVKKIKKATQELDKYNLSYSDALVDVYFYGYLHLILPNSGQNQPDMKKRINMYKLKNELEDAAVPVEKLFILIPSTGYSPPDLVRPNYRNKKRLKQCENLEPYLMSEIDLQNLENFTVSRDGIKKREYQTSIYRIFCRSLEHKYYVALESAPCLRQLYEASLRNPALRLFRDQNIKSFTKKLQLLLDDNDNCKDSCELIYFEVKDYESLPDIILRKILLSTTIESVKDTLRNHCLAY